MNPTKTILTERRGKIFIVSINRPQVKNAINAEAARELHMAFKRFEENDDLQVAILTGVGDTFCAGADLKAIAHDAADNLQVSDEGPAPLGISRLVMSKPVIAAIEGHAVAGGLELALWCDLRIAAEDSTFGVYCRRYGVPLVDGGTVRLPRLIGQSRAMDMIITGRPVEAGEALSFGLANRVVPKGTALTKAFSMANHLCTLPQICMRSDRLSVLEQWELPWDQALLNETKYGIEVIRSGETRAGAQRFVDR